METIVSSGGAVALPDRLIRLDRRRPPFERESSQPARIRVKPGRTLLAANLAQPKSLYADSFWRPEMRFSRARLGQGATDFAVAKASRDGGGNDTANMAGGNSLAIDAPVAVGATRPDWNVANTVPESAGAVSLLGSVALLPGLRRRCAGAGKVSTFPGLGRHR